MSYDIDHRNYSDFDEHGLWMFYEETKRNHGLEIAEEIYQLIINGQDSIDGSPDQKAEWAKSLIPKNFPDQFVEDNYYSEILNQISALQEIHNLPEPNKELQTDTEIYNQGVPRDAEFEVYTLGYGIADMIVSEEPITAEFYGQQIETTPQEIMNSIDTLNQKPGVEIRTPKHVDYYVEKKYGKGYRMLGREIDAFPSAPRNRDNHGITPTKEIAEATQELNGVVITINDVYTINEETNIAPPRWLANKK